MEKSTPHCKLPRVKALLLEGKVRSTFTALSGAAALGMDFDGMLGVLHGLTSKDFYKSMTTQVDSSVWQDVYRPSIPFGRVYLKLTVIDDVLIVSFKEL